MPNTTWNAEAFCPYFLAASRTSISCAGAVGHSVLIRFSDPQSMQEHFDNFCKHVTCAGCPLYRFDPEDPLVGISGKSFKRFDSLGLSK